MSSKFKYFINPADRGIKRNAARIFNRTLVFLTNIIPIALRMQSRDYSLMCEGLLWTQQPGTRKSKIPLLWIRNRSRPVFVWTWVMSKLYAWEIFRMKQVSSLLNYAFTSGRTTSEGLQFRQIPQARDKVMANRIICARHIMAGLNYIFHWIFGFVFFCAICAGVPWS